MSTTWLKVNDDGSVEVPRKTQLMLLRMSGVKSRKKRIVKKVIKKLVTRAILDYIESYEQQQQQKNKPT